MITYSKLKSGDWGIRSDRSLTPGTAVEVSKKDGSKKSETVGNEVWRGGGSWLYSISAGSGSRRPATPKGHGKGRCRECGHRIEDAPHHRAMGGLCGWCAFDEYDM